MGAPVFLTGMMGSGKSTAGRIVAQQRGAVFVDLDARMQRLFGASVEDLFAAGEESFREREHLALRALIAEPAFAARDVVVATGGGVVISAANREAMLAAGRVLHLDVPVAELASRLLAAGERRARPLLLASGERGLPTRLAEILAKRRSAYLDRATVIDGRGEPDVVAARIAAELGAGGADIPDTQAS